MKLEFIKPAKRRGRPRIFDRDQALEHAMQIFWRQGYEATSLSDLTTAMGINPPSLYAAFGDKERLFLEAIERYQNGLGNSASIIAKAPTARDAVKQLLEASAQELTRTDQHPPGCMVVTSTINVSNGSVHLQTALSRQRQASEIRIKNKIKRDIKNGKLSPNTNAAALAKFYMLVVQGMTIQARDGATPQELLTVAILAMHAWPST
jgi:TetR/AcrR family transcriptional regulator, copper-responsive repressor